MFKRSTTMPATFHDGDDDDDDDCDETKLMTSNNVKRLHVDVKRFSPSCEIHYPLLTHAILTTTTPPHTRMKVLSV